jgi:hypothetical protein
MYRSRATFVRVAVVVAAVAALCIAGTTPAASAGWVVEGTQLSGTAALATKAQVTEAVKLSASGVTIECAGTINGVSLDIQSPNKIAASSLTFNECKTTGESCTLATKAIGTVPVAAELTEQTTAEAAAAFLPKTKTVLATISFEGASCALTGVQPLSGKIKARLPGIERKSLPIAFLSESGQLKLGNNGAEIKGVAELKLASEKPVYFTDGEVIVGTGGGTPVYNVAANRFELKFAANETAEFSVGNPTAAEYTLEATQITPNELNFMFTPPVGVECRPPQGLKPGRANACFRSIKNLNVGSAKFKLEYKGKKVYELPLTR